MRSAIRVVLAGSSLFLASDSAAVVLNPGDLVVLGSGASVHKMDGATGAATLIAAPVPATDVALEPSGTILVVHPGTGSDAGQLVRIDPATGAPTVLATGLDAPRKVAVESNGRIYVDGPSGVRRVDPVTGAATLLYAGLAEGIAVDVGNAVMTTYVTFDQPPCFRRLNFLRVDRDTGATSIAGFFDVCTASTTFYDLEVSPTGDAYTAGNYVIDFDIVRPSSSPSGFRVFGGGGDSAPLIALDGSGDILRSYVDCCSSQIWRFDHVTGALTVPYPSVSFLPGELDVVPGTPPPADGDGDGVPDASDNCVSTPNPDQTDGDADGVGDVCDNCAAVANPGQEDADHDGIGDACEPQCLAAGNTGLLSPTFSSADTGGDGNGFELTPNGAFANGGTPKARNSNGPGDRHRWFGYGISVPQACIVKGIEVRLDWRLDAKGGSNSLSVELSWDGGLTWTAAKIDAVESTNEHTTVLGGPADSWGRAWTPAELGDAGFRVRLASNGTSAGRDWFLDWAPVRVTYGP